jgi:RimJ/RimL family protein N-acetyltransferase
MILTKDIIRLRPFKVDDFSSTFPWRKDKELRKLAQFHSFPVTIELEQEWIDSILKNKSDKVVYYAIENIEEEKIIGYFLLKNINWISRVAWLGIIIGEKNTRGKGYGNVALELGLNYAFNNLNLRKISLEVLSTNSTAIALYLKAGFTEEGEMKNHFYFESEYHDVKIMSLFYDKFIDRDNLSHS